MQPAAYVRQFNFTNFSATYPTLQQPGVSIDAELNAVKTTLTQVLANLALIQRDDTQLANSVVGLNQLKPELIIGVNAPHDWAAGSVYAVDTVVWHGGATLYRCLVAHTSGVFATDLAAGKWQDVLDYTDPLANAAASASAALGAQTGAETARDASEGFRDEAEGFKDDAEAAALAAAAYTGSIVLPLSIANGGTGAISAALARANLGLVIGVDVQTQNVNLQMYAGMAPAANKLPYFTSTTTAGLADFTAFARTLLDDADANAVKTTLSLNNVENKSSATIRSELSSGNVTGALGFTPMNAASYTNVENKSSATIRNELTSGNVTGALGYTPFNNASAGTMASQNANNVSITGGTISVSSFTGTSDETLKERIRPLPNPMPRLRQIQPVMFDYITGRKQVSGLIAQRLLGVYPERVRENVDTGKLEVFYLDFIADLIEAVKQQDARLSLLERGA